MRILSLVVYCIVQKWLAEEYVKDTDLKKTDMKEALKDAHIVMSTCFVKTYIVHVAEHNLEQKENQNYVNYNPSIVLIKTSIG